jgi:N utilization substance protein B
MQLLFQRDCNAQLDRDAAARFARERLKDARSEEYCLRLYDGVVARAEEIDARLTEAADNWKPARMAGTDRNVLRVGILELMLNDPETPPPVILDEAVELARRFGGADSSKFVNGVLDRVRKMLAQPPETA